MIRWVKNLFARIKQELAYKKKLKAELKELEKLDPYDYK